MAKKPLKPIEQPEPDIRPIVKLWKRGEHRKAAEGIAAFGPKGVGLLVAAIPEDAALILETVAEYRKA